MSDAHLIHIEYDGVCEQVYGEKISETIYRCLESCVFIDFINYGCEVEVEEGDGKLNFLWLYKESPFKKHVYIWSKEIVESPECNKMKEEILKIGGYWEGMMGGVFMIHLPKNKTEELSRLFEILNSV